MLFGLQWLVWTRGMLMFHLESQAKCDDQFKESMLPNANILVEPTANVAKSTNLLTACNNGIQNQIRVVAYCSELLTSCHKHIHWFMTQDSNTILHKYNHICNVPKFSLVCTFLTYCIRKEEYTNVYFWIWTCRIKHSLLQASGFTIIKLWWSYCAA